MRVFCPCVNAHRLSLWLVLSNARIRLLPYSIDAVLGPFFGIIIGFKKRVAVVQILFLGALLQLLGLALLSTPSTTREFLAKRYGFETTAGVGFRVIIANFLLAAPFMANPCIFCSNPFRIQFCCASVHLLFLSSLSATATYDIVYFCFTDDVTGLSIALRVMDGYLKTHVAEDTVFACAGCSPAKHLCSCDICADRVREDH